MTTDPLLAEAGTGRPVLLLHGGGGPATVAPLAAHLAGSAHVLTPVHPGWDGTERPAALSRVADLADAYLDLLRRRGLRDVLVVGSSLGGWIGAEMALRDGAGNGSGNGNGSGATVSGLVLIDAVGIGVDGEPLTDVFALDARGLAEHSWHDPDRHFIDPATLPPAELARRRGNAATMRALAGDPYMHDPGLRERLRDVRLPVLVLWGESDRVATPGYGAAYARAFADARFVTVPGAGHLPHLERPEAVFAHLDTALMR
ncbi:alpha/beta fold hydrolase [Kitasatospora phosalacinea]|uniref:Alpha/beta hydrolase n=1 Tax=Kitasatospora phosalacinea TaxID=2065 RepID=A0A9W6PGL2_9ACTN|nr:alpha/beta hydrolase [Kitasatospora phosalacinea]GLW54741.1 alpha/beta hydrolase [Kitasatospora phosalacinea]